MAAASEKQLAVRYMLLGMLVMLVIVGLVWGVAHLAGPGDDTPATTPKAGAVAVAQDDGSPRPGADEVPESSKVTDLEAKAAASAAALEKKAADLKAADAPEGKEAPTAEELEEQRRQEDAKREAMQQKEIAFMEDSFDEMKPKLMGIIDAYFDKPMEERPDYFRQAMKEFGETMRAEREAAGLPGRPRGRPRMMGEFLRVANEKFSDEEKTKVKAFMGDVMQMQMARFQSEVDSRLKTSVPKSTAPPDNPDDIRLR